MKDPQAIHRLDQSTAALGEIAGVLASYHASLVAQGFTREEALKVVIAYQASFAVNKGGES